MLRSQHAEATRGAVLAAARRSFGRKGYAQASVDEIAAAARVTKGAVYHHFADKEALFRAVHAVVEAEAQARAAAATLRSLNPRIFSRTPPRWARAARCVTAPARLTR